MEKQNSTLSTDKSKDIKAQFHIAVNVVKRNWYYYLGCIVVCVVLARSVNYIKQPIFNIEADIILADKNNSQSGQSGNNSSPVLNLITDKSSLENEIAVLNSPRLIKSVVEDLQLNIKLKEPGKLRSREIFDNQPLLVNTNSGQHSNQVSFTIDIISNTEYLINVNNKTIKNHFGQKLKGIASSDITLTPTVYIGKFIGKKLQISIQDPASVAIAYSAKFAAQKKDKNSDVVHLSLKETNGKRGTAVLSKIIDKYAEQELAQRNQSSDQAYNFLTERIDAVSKELHDLEKDMQDYKLANQIVNVEVQATNMLNGNTEVEKQIQEGNLQITLINQYKEYFNEHLFSVAPFYPNVQNYPIVVDAVSKYNALQSERAKAMGVYKEKNPIIKDMDNELAKLRKELMFDLDKIAAEIELKNKQCRDNSSSYKNQLASMPVKERGLLEFTRKQTLLQDLYVFLLKSREEIALTREQKISSVKLVASPVGGNYPIQSGSQNLIVAAMIFGIAIPSAGIMMKHRLNNKVMGICDISAATDTPIIGKIGHISGKKTLKNQEIQNISEQFRYLRANLLMNAGKNKTILITSSIEGEGKSFISVNVSKSLATLGKRVILLEMDLRQPVISKNIGLYNLQGFSDYINNNATYNNIIHSSNICDGLYILPVGVSRCNPAEALCMDKTKMLIEQLKNDFDYIIIDTPPIGLVSDAQVLSNIVDTTLYVVRFDYTTTEHFNVLNELVKEEKLPNVNIVFNDINTKRISYGDSYGYGNSYGYGYVYGYNSSNGKKRVTKYIDVFE